MHQRNAVAPLRFVHEVGRDKDRHALVARQTDQVAPKGIAGDRIDARGRLVEEQHLGPVDDGDRKLQALLLPQGQAFGPAVGDAEQIEPLEHFLHARFSAILRQVIQVGMQFQVLPDGEFAIKREGLRHVADAFARRHVAGVESDARRAAPLLRSAASKPVSIFIVVLLPQPLEPRKPKISPRSIRKLT